MDSSWEDTLPHQEKEENENEEEEEEKKTKRKVWSLSKRKGPLKKSSNKKEAAKKETEDDTKMKSAPVVSPGEGRVSFRELEDPADNSPSSPPPQAPTSFRKRRGSKKRFSSLANGQASLLDRQQSQAVNAFLSEFQDGPDLLYGEVVEEGVPSIKAASVEKLFEILVGEKCSPSFRKAFFLTYPSFTDAGTIMTHHVNLFKKEGEANQKESRLGHRVVFNLKTWLEENPFDFLGKKDGNLSSHLSNFFGYLEETQSLDHAQTLKSCLRQKEEAVNFIYPIFMEPPNLPGKTPASWIEVDTQHAAEQITIWMSEVYGRVSPAEVATYVKEGKGAKRGSLCPNLGILIQQFNDLSSWVTTCVCKEYRRTERAIALANMAHLGTKLFQMNNFHGAFSVKSALNNSVIGRLQSTHRALETMQEATLKFAEFADLQEILCHTASYKKYRQHLKAIKPPCVLYMGVSLTDITFLNDGNPDLIENLVNFGKRTKIASVIAEIQDGQVHFSELKRDVNFQKYLKNLSDHCNSNEENYHISKCVDPRSSDEVTEHLLKSEKELTHQVKELSAEIEKLKKMLCSSCLSRVEGEGTKQKQSLQVQRTDGKRVGVVLTPEGGVLEDTPTKTIVHHAHDSSQVSEAYSSSDEVADLFENFTSFCITNQENQGNEEQEDILKESPRQQR